MRDEEFERLYDEVENGKSIEEVMESLQGEAQIEFSRRYLATKGSEVFSVVAGQAESHNPYIVDYDIGKIPRKH